MRPSGERTAAIDEDGACPRFGADAVELVIGDEQHLAHCHAAELRCLRVGRDMRLERIRFGHRDHSIEGIRWYFFASNDGNGPSAPESPL